MIKYKFFLDLNKEEKWLNEMEKQGYQLVRKWSGYHFQRTEPEETNIRVDYRIFKKKEDFQDYVALFADSGWTHIAGSKNSGAQYFRKNSESSSEEIFSDSSSKAGRYKRMSEMWLSLACTYIPISIVFMMMDVNVFDVIFDPKSLYQTPGLWEKSGLAFLGAFLFETPFAFFRGFGFFIFPISIFLCCLFAIKAEKLYKTTR
ncbi:DUF2812 domain-containing protein [Bacillaceae bacterium Marseille-Q3522]|nr:DUF2812 domain-containing protein [Bacillaceae bacterium Marseille-Q3522]